MPERRAPAAVRAVQERALAKYVTGEVYAYSAFYRPRLDVSGLTRRSTPAEVLQRLPVTTFEDLHDAGALVLRPDERLIQRYAGVPLVARVAWAKFLRRTDELNRTVIDPMYKPVHWHVDDGLPVGYSATDVERLADLGRRWLAMAQLSRYDVAVGLLPAGPTLAYWQLVLGCQRASLSALHLAPNAPAAQVESLQPTVLAGRPADLERLLNAARRERRVLPRLHTLLVAGEPLDARGRVRLRELCPHPDVALVAAWAPPGARSLWVECRGGDEYHTSPEVELVEVVDPATSRATLSHGHGELLWSALGWRGSVLLRLRTGVTGTVDDSPCPHCGSTAPRVQVSPPEPGFVRVLDATAGVAGWQAELRTVNGVEELIVYLALEGRGHPGPLLQSLDQQLSVTQFVVLDRRALNARITETGTRVLDRRDGAGGASR